MNSTTTSPKLKAMYERETEGSLVYKEFGTRTIGSLYVRKDSEIGKLRPKWLDITVEAGTPPS